MEKIYFKNINIKKISVISLMLVSILTLSWCEWNIDDIKNKADQAVEQTKWKINNTVNEIKNKAGKKVKETVEEIKEKTTDTINKWINQISNNVKQQVNNKIDEVTNETKQQVSEAILWKDNILAKYNWEYKWNTVIKDFYHAKKYLYILYNKYLPKQYRKTIYCWCSFS